MANLIIKSSADNLVLQGSDASPAITVGATGTTTFAENATLSGTANNVGTVTAGTIGSAVVFQAGTVVQTITATTNTDTNAGTNASYTLITNMAGTITPKYANSKILIGMYCGGMIMTAVDSIYLKITGTTTGTVTEKTRYPGYYNQSSWVPAPIAVQVVDTPGTTNAQTYQLYAKIQTGTTVANYRLNSYESSNTQGGTIIIQEIKV